MGLILKIIGYTILIFFLSIILFYYKYLRPLTINSSNNLTKKNTHANSKSTLLPNLNQFKTRRRGLRYKNLSEDEDDCYFGGGGLREEEVKMEYRFTSKPYPIEIKSVLKRNHLLLPSNSLLVVGDNNTSEDTNSDDSTTSTTTRMMKKQVRLLEPSKVSLEALREFWKNKNLEGDVDSVDSSDGGGGGGSGNGIGGYRRTRDFIINSKNKSSNTKIGLATITTPGTNLTSEPVNSIPTSPTSLLQQTLSPTSISTPSYLNQRLLPRHHSPSQSSSSSNHHTRGHSHSPSPSRISSLRPPSSSSSSHSRNLSPNSIGTERSNSPISTFSVRTHSPLGSVRRRIRSNSYNSNNSTSGVISNGSTNNTTTTSIIGVEKATPRWISNINKNTSYLDQEELDLEGEVVRGEKGAEEEEDSEYEDVDDGSSGSDGELECESTSEGLIAEAS